MPSEQVFAAFVTVFPNFIRCNNALDNQVVWYSHTYTVQVIFLHANSPMTLPFALFANIPTFLKSPVHNTSSMLFFFCAVYITLKRLSLFSDGFAYLNSLFPLAINSQYLKQLIIILTYSYLVLLFHSLSHNFCAISTFFFSSLLPYSAYAIEYACSCSISPLFNFA